MRCGKHLRFRDLVECGETWTALANTSAAIGNQPARAETFRALEHLCRVVLDPVIDEFGSIELTYGFSGRELSNHIKRTVGHVAPARDQHASHDPNSRGNAICSRGGAAADFRVPERSSLEIAQWVARNTAFDRLYLYAASLPIHVSASAQPAGDIVEMRQGSSGRRFPRVRTLDWLLHQPNGRP